MIFVLSVGHAPDFIRKLHSVKAPIGGEAVFTVQSDGKPVPEVMWYVTQLNIFHQQTKFKLQISQFKY